MKLAREKRGSPAAVDAATAADTVVAGKAASEEATDEFANNGSGRAFGQGWIRTSEGVKPADLQSAPFGHFGTYPSNAAIDIGSCRAGCKWSHRDHEVSLNDEIRVTNAEHSSLIERVPRIRSEW